MIKAPLCACSLGGPPMNDEYVQLQIGWKAAVVISFLFLRESARDYPSKQMPLKPRTSLPLCNVVFVKWIRKKNGQCVWCSFIFYCRVHSFFEFESAPRHPGPWFT